MKEFATLCENYTNLVNHKQGDQSRKIACLLGHMRMFSLGDGRKQHAIYQRKTNNYIKHCQGLCSPNQVLVDYPTVL